MNDWKIPELNLPKFEMPRMPEVKVASLSLAEIKSMPDDELLSILSGDKNVGGLIPMPLQQAITAELLARNIKKGSAPHWSLTPSFWLLVSSVLIAVIALIVAIAGLPQIQSRYFSNSSSQPSSTQNPANNPAPK